MAFYALQVKALEGLTSSTDTIGLPLDRRIINMAWAEKRNWGKEMNKFKRHPTTSSYKGDILFLL